MRIKNALAARVWICALSVALLAACGRSAQWTDEALLHDGKVMEVRRTVAFHHGLGELSETSRQYPDQFAIEAINPSTGKQLRWSGERDIKPIALDFVEGVPYLVVLSERLYEHGTLYGCPEVPYAFLRYDGAHWKPISRDAAPAVLTIANLSMDYPSGLETTGEHQQSTKEIAERNYWVDATSAHFYSAKIPENFAAWPYRMKERFSMTRYPSDCRPPVPHPVDALFPESPAPSSTPVNLEVVDATTYEPPRSMSHDEWERLTWNRQRSENCKRLLKPTDGNNMPALDKYSAFIKSPNRVTGNAMWICDEDALWVGDYVSERGRIVLVKANATGDVLYRISFDKPADPDPYSGHLWQSSLREEGGFLYFNWANTSSSGSNVRIRRILKFKVPVPSAR